MLNRWRNRYLSIKNRDKFKGWFDRYCIYKPNTGSGFVEYYKGSIYEGELQEPSQNTQSESSEPVDYIEKLKEIKSLLDAGIINEEDFEKMKQKIIDNM